MGILSFVVPGLAHILTGFRGIGLQYLATALLIWGLAASVFLGASPWWVKVLTLFMVLAVHVGSGLTYRAEEWAKVPNAPDLAPATYRQWSVLIAGAIALFLAAQFVVWIVSLPNWNQVQRNFLFFLVGRMRSTDNIAELWRMWGLGAFGLGAGLSWWMWRANIKQAALPILLGLIVGSVLLWPTLMPDVRVGGLALSLILAVLGIALAIPVGLLFGIGRTTQLPFIRGISTVYIELFRGLPLIAVIFWFFLFLPMVLGEGTQFWAVVLALSLFSGAYVAEIVRAGIQSLPKGQAEAARASGLSGTQAMLYVILPQAINSMIPPLVGQFISLFKDTSLVSIIGMIELTGAAKITGNRVVVASFEIYLAVALLYFVFAFMLSRLARQLETRPTR